jgi:hypothetical protein
MVNDANAVQFLMHDAAKVYDDPAAGIEYSRQMVGLQATMSALDIKYVPAGIECRYQ